VSNFPHFLSVLSQGVVPTVELSVGGIILATIDAFAAGLLSRSRFRSVRFAVRAYVEGWRGSSELVQLFWLVLVAPTLIGLHLIPIWAGIIALGLNVGAYGAEVVRGAVDAVPKPQHEGAIALSLSSWQRMRLVILPQALVEMVPSFTTLFIQLIQATALVSLVYVHEITYQAKQILTADYPVKDDPLIWTMVLVIYLILAVILVAIMRVLERGLARYAGRVPQRRVQMASILRPARLRLGRT
jgi:polar amino acid transport system permease protein